MKIGMDNKRQILIIELTSRVDKMIVLNFNRLNGNWCYNIIMCRYKQMCIIRFHFLIIWTDCIEIISGAFLDSAPAFSVF